MAILEHIIFSTLIIGFEWSLLPFIQFAVCIIEYLYQKYWKSYSFKYNIALL